MCLVCVCDGRQCIPREWSGLVIIRLLNLEQSTILLVGSGYGLNDKLTILLFIL